MACCLLLFLPLSARAARAQTIVYGGAAYTVCTVDPRRDDLRLYWRNPETGHRYRSLGGLARWAQRHGKRLVFATNAGIFAPGYTPLGLYVENGRVRVPLNQANGGGNFFLKPNGVFALDAGGKAHIAETNLYPGLHGPIRLATQSGPLLLTDGKIHPAFQPGSINRKIRSGVGILPDGRLVFAITDVTTPVNFYDFARLFLDRFHCRNALYLDGGISKMFAAGVAEDTGGEFAGIFGVMAPTPQGQRER